MPYYNEMMMIMRMMMMTLPLDSQTQGQIWSNKSFSVCDSSGVLTLYVAEKKSTQQRPLETLMTLITLQPLPRCHDAVIKCANFGFDRSSGSEVAGSNFPISYRLEWSSL